MKKKHKYAKRKNILAAKEVKQHVFFFWGGEGAGFFFVPITFPNMFPIAPHFFIPYSLPLSSILENLYIQPKGGDCNISILGLSKA